MNKLAEALHEEAADLALSAGRLLTLQRRFSLIRDRDRRLLAGAIAGVKASEAACKILEDQVRGEG